MILLCDETIRKFLSKTVTFSDYEKQYKSLEKRVSLFIFKLRSRVFKKKMIIKRFIQKIKYKKLCNNPPCNEEDLYTYDTYDVNNKNVYLIDIRLNKKWWFCIETITKLLCNNLSHFDTETYDILSKAPVNPYTNRPLNICQLISIYEQLKNHNKVNKLIMLFRLTNFSINKFLKMYNDDIINYSYKYNLDSLDDEGILTILNNLLYLYNINYVNINKVEITNEVVRNDVIYLIKNCLFTYKKNQKNKIKSFINNNKSIIRRANRNFDQNNINCNRLNNNNNNNNNEDINTDTDNSTDNVVSRFMDINLDTEESFEWTTYSDSDDDINEELENLLPN